MKTYRGWKLEYVSTSDYPSLLSSFYRAKLQWGGATHIVSAESRAQIERNIDKYIRDMVSIVPSFPTK